MSSTEVEGERFGLVLGGGGARGFAHLGVLQVLQEEGLQPDLVVGTSMGSLMGAAFAAGVDLHKLPKVLKELDINGIIGVSPVGRHEIEKLIGRSLTEQFRRSHWDDQEEERSAQLDRMYRFFQLFTKGNAIEDLEMPFAAIATDLRTGKEIVLREGKLYKAVTASSAIPGFISPVRWKDRLLIDGGVVDKVPTNVAVDMGADVVLAADVSSRLQGLPQNSVELLLRADVMTSRELVRVKNEWARRRLEGRLLIVHPRMKDLNWLDFSQVEEALEMGRKCALDNLDRIERLLKGREVEPVG
jgi:NTE family protein